MSLTEEKVLMKVVISGVSGPPVAGTAEDRRFVRVLVLQSAENGHNHTGEIAKIIWLTLPATCRTDK